MVWPRGEKLMQRQVRWKCGRAGLVVIEEGAAADLIAGAVQRRREVEVMP
jgi:hypothetical protein